jgi:hypothetical protein
MSLKALLPWNWVKLDPARTRAARAHFDVTGNYDAWHAMCRSQFARHIPVGPDVVGRDGMEVVNILTPAEAGAAKNLLLEKAKEFTVKKKQIDYADVLRFESTDFLLPVLKKTFNKEIDEKIVRFFGSEYFVQAVVANRTMPAKESKRSFLWHCDRGPRNFLKINMFLDATSEHGGTTEFLDLGSSQVFEDAGYTFGANNRRVSDLSGIARKIGASASVVHPQLAAGQAFMFLPSRSLHRGFLPTRGIRHMLLLVILPSPIHWSKAWNLLSKSGYYDTEGDSFPDDAAVFLEKFGLENLKFDRAA